MLLLGSAAMLLLLVSGDDEAALRALRHTAPGVPQLEARSVTAVPEALVRLDDALAGAERPDPGASTGRPFPVTLDP